MLCILGYMEQTLSEIIQQKYVAMAPHLNERSLRTWAASEALAIGHGGKKILHAVTGLSYTTIHVGTLEIEAAEKTTSSKMADKPEDNAQSKTNIQRIRKSGGGRKSKLLKDPTLKRDLLNIIESTTRGDPESPLLWSCKSTRHIADSLNKENTRVSHNLVSKILSEMGYSLQGNRKIKEGAGHPDRDAQFNFINNKTKEFQKKNQPVISVDTKKKELIGEFKNAGQEYCKKGHPTKVNTYDFIDKALGKAAPYGVYDLSKNNGWVSVGVSCDTAEFAVNSIRSWWFEMGEAVYKDATEIYINADGGGSNGTRVRMWKTELQKFANEIGKIIHVSHFPPGTSKWNKIEHKMFCFISKNWRGRPLIDTATIVGLIANTTTKKGLTINAKLDDNIYQAGIKISDEEIRLVKIEKDPFHGEWNYKIMPDNSQVIL